MVDPRSAAAPNAIVTEDLSLSYGDFQALFNVSLEVKQGLITSLIGPSGCGKSTLLRTVNRINDRLGYVRTTGRVEVSGQNTLDPSVEPAQLRKEVGTDAARFFYVMRRCEQHLDFDLDLDFAFDPPVVFDLDLDLLLDSLVGGNTGFTSKLIPIIIGESGSSSSTTRCKAPLSIAFRV